jgi:hypothetical protein
MRAVSDDTGAHRLRVAADGARRIPLDATPTGHGERNDQGNPSAPGRSSACWGSPWRIEVAGAVSARRTIARHALAVR